MTAIATKVPSRARPPSRAQPPSRAHLLALLLFLSSAAAMMVELAWQPALIRRLGEDAELATMLILAFGFALGLGLGCLVGGLRSRPSPLPLLAALAALNGANGLAGLAVDEATAGPALIVAPAFISAALMGIMAPVALAHLIRRAGGAGRAFGECLCVIMLGLAVACLASAAVILPLFGERDALRLGVALDAVVVVGALVTRWHETQQPALNDAPLLQRQPLLAFAPSLWLAAAAGVLAMSYLLFFARVVAYAAAPGQSILTATLAATLAAFLLGLAAGAHRAGRHCALFSGEEVMRRTARSAMVANLIGLLTLPLLEQLAWLDRAVLVVAMLLCFMLARALGALLPYLAELATMADARVQPRSARLCVAYVLGAYVLGAHVMGAAAGVWLTGRVLMDALDLVAVGVALVMAGILYTLLLVALLDLPRWQKVVRGMTAVAVAILALAVLPRWSADVVERIAPKAAADTAPVTLDRGRS